MKRSRTLLLLTLALAASTTFAACSAAAAAEPGTGPDDPISAPPITNPIDPTVPGGAQPVEPVPGIVNPIPHAWDHIDVAADGRTITVYYWGGVDSCYGLDHVDVSIGADGLLHVTVFEGQRGDLGNGMACIEIAVLKSVTITLDQPIIAPSA